MQYSSVLYTGMRVLTVYWPVQYRQYSTVQYSTVWCTDLASAALPRTHPRWWQPSPSRPGTTECSRNGRQAQLDHCHCHHQCIHLKYCIPQLLDVKRQVLLPVDNLIYLNTAVDLCDRPAVVSEVSETWIIQFHSQRWSQIITGLHGLVYKLYQPPQPSTAEILQGLDWQSSVHGSKNADCSCYCSLLTYFVFSWKTVLK